MRQFAILLVVSFFTVVNVSPAIAGPILLGGFSGGESIETFTLGSTPATGPFTLGNFTFSEASTGSGSAGWRIFIVGSGPPVLTDNAGISDITIDAASSFQRIGLDVGFFGTTTWNVSFFDPSLVLLGTVTGSNSGTGTSFFAGWEDLGGISRIQLIETSGENGLVGGLDTLRWENVSVAVPDSDGDGVNDPDDFCPVNTAIPESVPTSGALNPNHWALTAAGNGFDFDTVIKGKGKGPNRSYTIEDTAGCSCEQIIEIQGLGDGHSKHGCSISAMDDWIDFVNP